MAITIETQYSKKLGLPGYSSHQYSVTVRTEVNDLAQIEGESAKLYRLLQDSVDGQIQQPGFVGQTNGNPSPPPAASNGKGNWKCSPKQKDLILKIVEEHHLDKDKVEELSRQRFSLPVKELNKLQASGLIEALIEQTGGNATQRNGKSFSRGGRS